MSGTSAPATSLPQVDHEDFGTYSIAYTGLMDPEALVRFVEDHRAVARREAEESRRQGHAPVDAVTSALALLAVYGRLHGWPPADDPVSDAEDAAVRDRFDRLRRWYRRRS